MKFQKMLASFLAILLIAGLMTGCSGGSQSQATQEAAAETTAEAPADAQTESETEGEAAGGTGSLVMAWWGNQVRNEGTTKALALYTEQTGVNVEGQFYQWDDYWNKMATAAAGNDLPDVIQMDFSVLAQYGESGQIIDLTPYIESGAINTENVEDSVLDVGKVGDALYGIPAGLSCKGLVYNKTITDSLGIEMKDNMTLDEFVEIAKKVTEETGYRADIMYRAEYVNMWARAEGIAVSEAKPPVDSYEPYVPVFQLLEDGIKEGWHITPDVLDGTATETSSLVYGSDPSTMSWCTLNGGSNLLTAFQTAAPEGTEIAITTLPTNDVKKSNSLGAGSYYSISSDCEDPDAAAALIDWLINSEDCNNILLGERGTPASTTITESLMPQVDSATAAAMNFVSNVIAPNCSPAFTSPDGTSELNETLSKIQEAIGYGEMTAEEGAKEYYDKMVELWGE